MGDGTPDAIAISFQRDDDRNRQFYTRLLAQHGECARALNWGSAASQQARFQAVAEIGIGPASSVLDVGCGIGDLLGFLRVGGFGGRYLGIDLTPAMVEAAQRRHPDAIFELANLLELDPARTSQLSADFVVASGIFYLRREQPMLFLRTMVERMFSLCRIATAFNLLSSWTDRVPEAGEFRADPLEVVEVCHGITPFIAMRHDYYPGDFTIYMRRAAAPATPQRA